MLKIFKKTFSMVLVGILMISGATTISNAEDVSAEVNKEQMIQENLNANDENSIKDVVEAFVKEDYNFNGGKNELTTVGTEEFKQYLIARNEVKKTNNDRIGYNVFDQRYDFDYKNLEKQDDVVKINLYVHEIFSYDDSSGRTEDAEVGNNYVIYLSKVDGYWKVMSATIDVEVDPVDNEFNVNKELGYEGNKSNNRSTTDNNLKLMLNKLDNLKALYSEPLKEDSNEEVKEVNNVQRLGAITNSQRQQIYDYAYAYRMERRNPNYLSFPSDCANYASQALRKAGARADNNHSIYIDGKNRTWSLTPDSWHINPTYGDAWAQAHYLRAFLVRNENGYRGPGGYTITYGSQLQLGDITFIHNGSTWFHTYIVVAPGPNFKIASHTGNRWMVNINTAAPEAQYPRSYVHITTLN
jgi:hypothetical protein